MSKENKSISDMEKLLSYHEHEGNKILIHPAQCFADGKIFFSIFTDNIYIINSAKEVFTIENPPERYKVIKSSTVPQLRIATCKKFLGLGTLEQEYDKKNFAAYEIFVKIKEYFDTYIFFNNSNHSTVLTLWVIGTYIFTCFKYYPYLHFQAEKRSGKTLTLDLLSKISFNAELLTNITAAALFRTVNNNRSCLLIDEVEKLKTSDRENYGELMSILNTGFQDSGKVVRCEKVKDSFKPIFYSTYSPKALAGISDLDDVLQDRVIQIVMKRKKSNEFRLRFRNTRELEIKINNLKQELYLFALQYAPALNSSYETIQNDIILPNVLQDRERDMFEPLATIAKVIEFESSQLGNKETPLADLYSFAKEKAVERAFQDNLNNPSAFILKFIFDCYSNGNSNIFHNKNGSLYISRNYLWRKFEHEGMHEELELPINTRQKLTTHLNRILHCPYNNFLKVSGDKEWHITMSELNDVMERYIGLSLPIIVSEEDLETTKVLY